MPTLIESIGSDAAIKEAKYVVARFCTSLPKSARAAPTQGMYSRTTFVTLHDETQVVVQLKDNDIDLTKVALARSLLGDVVPVMQAANTTLAHFAYVSPLVPGTVWFRAGMTTEQDVELAYQTALILAKCSLGVDSTGTVDNYILPRLRELLGIVENESMRSRIQALFNIANCLKSLPLSLCHIDVNASNVGDLLDKMVEQKGLTINRSS
uniref:Uncharacterized protein n=1 Tax=Moniliophthora roreri TaxID=221103 RepID=A0A0W0GEB6_MONRR